MMGWVAPAKLEPPKPWAPPHIGRKAKPRSCDGSPAVPGHLNIPGHASALCGRGPATTYGHRLDPRKALYRCLLKALSVATSSRFDCFNTLSPSFVTSGRLLYFEL